MFDYQCYSTHRKYFFLALVHKTKLHHSGHPFKNATEKNVYILRLFKTNILASVNVGPDCVQVYRCKSNPGRLRLRSAVFTLQKRIQLAGHFKGIVQPKIICLVSRNVYKTVLGSKGKWLQT